MEMWFCKNSNVALLYLFTGTTMLCPTGVFAEHRKIQSDTFKPSDHYTIYLNASGGYTLYFNEHSTWQPPTAAACTELSVLAPQFLHYLYFECVLGLNEFHVLCFARGHRGTGRSAVTPRGTTAAAHTKPTAVLTREGQAPRARGAAANSAYRTSLLAVTSEAYDEYVSPVVFALTE